jgi:hypothetical protein
MNRLAAWFVSTTVIVIVCAWLFPFALSSLNSISSASTTCTGYAICGTAAAADEPLSFTGLLLALPVSAPPWPAGEELLLGWRLCEEVVGGDR